MTMVAVLISPTSSLYFILFLVKHVLTGLRKFRGNREIGVKQSFRQAPH